MLKFSLMGEIVFVLPLLNQWVSNLAVLAADYKYNWPMVFFDDSMSKALFLVRKIALKSKTLLPSTRTKYINKKMNIWILQTGEPLPVDGNNTRAMRAMNLSKCLVENGHKVVIWSADFFHQQKVHRYGENKVISVTPYLEVRLLASPGYKKNIGLGRLMDHFFLARNLRNVLRREQNIPDVAFIGYPPIETADVMISWLSKRGVPTLLDIKDQWPSLFLDALPKRLHLIGRVLFLPYFFQAKRLMKRATGVSTMSESFLSWSRSFSDRDPHETDGVFPLTSNLGPPSINNTDESAKWWDEMGIKDDGVNICFVGSLSPAFDFEPIRDAAHQALTNNLKVRFVLCGKGDEAENVKLMMAGLTNVFFADWIDRPKIESLAKRCEASIAPYINTDNFTMNIPNKIIDALALGLPLLSPLDGEVKKLIEDNNVGYCYGMKGAAPLYDCILSLVNNKLIQTQLSNNSRKLYEEKFEFDRVYTSLMRHLEKMAKSSQIGSVETSS